MEIVGDDNARHVPTGDADDDYVPAARPSRAVAFRVGVLLACTLVVAYAGERVYRPQSQEPSSFAGRQFEVQRDMMVLGLKELKEGVWGEGKEAGANFRKRKPLLQKTTTVQLAFKPLAKTTQRLAEVQAEPAEVQAEPAEAPATEDPSTEDPSTEDPSTEPAAGAAVADESIDTPVESQTDDAVEQTDDAAADSALPAAAADAQVPPGMVEGQEQIADNAVPEDSPAFPDVSPKAAPAEAEAEAEAKAAAAANAHAEKSAHSWQQDFPSREMRSFSPLVRGSSKQPPAAKKKDEEGEPYGGFPTETSDSSEPSNSNGGASANETNASVVLDYCTLKGTVLAVNPRKFLCAGQGGKAPFSTADCKMCGGSADSCLSPAAALRNLSPANASDGAFVGWTPVFQGLESGGGWDAHGEGGGEASVTEEEFDRQSVTLRLAGGGEKIRALLWANQGDGAHDPEWIKVWSSYDGTNFQLRDVLNVTALRGNSAVTVRPLKESLFKRFKRRCCYVLLTRALALTCGRRHLGLAAHGGREQLARAAAL
jgi:hypothetical protein